VGPLRVDIPIPTDISPRSPQVPSVTAATPRVHWRTPLRVAGWSLGSFDAIVRADPAVVLGLAAGELTLDQVAADIITDGEEQAVQAAFD
jgi:hypothetical protein